MSLKVVQNQEIVGLNKEYLEEWIAYREEDLKKPMTPRAIKMLTKKLLKWSEEEQERIICHSIEMNWKGVYYIEKPREKDNGTQQRTGQNTGKPKQTAADRLRASARLM